MFWVSKVGMKLALLSSGKQCQFRGAAAKKPVHWQSVVRLLAYQALTASVAEWSPTRHFSSIDDWSKKVIRQHRRLVLDGADRLWSLELATSGRLAADSDISTRPFYVTRSHPIRASDYKLHTDQTRPGPTYQLMMTPNEFSKYCIHILHVVKSVFIGIKNVKSCSRSGGSKGGSDRPQLPRGPNA